MNITVSAYNRPDHLRLCLAGLSRCIGISSSHVSVVCDLSDRTPECIQIAREHGFDVVENESRLGCNATIKRSLTYAVAVMGSEFHAHIEDDIVPSRDLLEWFSWARDTYENDSEIFTISGYQRKGNGECTTCGRRRKFTPWGWATWLDRLIQIGIGIDETSKVSWDVQANVTRGTRKELFPSVSRVDNIGPVGEHMHNSRWHECFVSPRYTADSLGYVNTGSFTEVPQ
jgi:hypothetical protein